MKRELVLEWDTAKIATNAVADRIENKEALGYGDLTDEQIEEQVNEDSDLYTWEWEYLCEALTELMKKISYRNYYDHYYWYAEVVNFGWRSQSGDNYFKAETGEELLRAILPKTNCTFRIYRESNRLSIQNFHHDSPVGKEWYHVRAMDKAEVEEKFLYQMF